jgi:hypothetical protein
MIAYAAKPSEDPQYHNATLGGRVSQYADSVDPGLPDPVLPAPLKAALPEPILGPGRKDWNGPPAPGSTQDQMSQILTILGQITSALKAVGILQ